MVRQRLTIRSRIFSVYSKKNVVVDDSRSRDYNNQSTFQRRRHELVVVCRPVTNNAIPIFGLAFFVCLMVVWSGYENIVLRKVRISKIWSVNIAVLESPSTSNYSMLEKTPLPERQIDDMNIDEVLDSKVDYLSLNEKSTDTAILMGTSLPNTISDLAISSSNAKNSSQAVHNDDPCYRMKNDADIRLCYASHGVKTFSEQRCQSIQNWNDVQHCLMRRYQYSNMKTNSSRIKEVHVVGERNSGTKFITQFLQQCYPKSSKIRVHRDFIRSKHFFQPIHPKADYTNSLIVVVVRDPIDWMAAMREFPYHSPSHLASFQNSQVVPLPWQEFVNKTWTTEPSKADRKLTAENRTKVTCTQAFRFDEVKPCILRENMITGPPWNIPLSRVRGYYPLYEQRRGKPYDHLLQMRSDKIVNWVLQIPLLMKIGGFIVVRYEDILEGGNEYFLQQVNAIVNSHSTDHPKSLPKHCPVIAPQPERIGKRYVDPDFKDWINLNLNVETERLIGYR